jgi:hypothetical protein
MAGSKIADLKLAAKDMIDIVVWSDQSEFTSRVAIAPFSEYVNVGRGHFRAITGFTPTGSGDRYTCVRERTTSSRYTDAAPRSSNYFQRGPTTGTCQPTATIVPLSNDKDMLKAEIDALATNGYTAGHLGTAWAWYLMSPNWSGVWASESAPRPYSEITTQGPKGQPLLQKIAVLMTDGEYNKQYSGSSSTIQARAICEAMKATGITVYTVGFQIAEGGEADQTMRQCASTPDAYYNAGDGGALRSAFRDIALKIATLRLAE